VSHRSYEVKLGASSEEVKAECKRVAAALGWRLTDESPRQLYFQEPLFSLRRVWWNQRRLEVVVRLEPEEAGTQASFAFERLGALQAFYVERDVALFLARLSAALREEAGATARGEQWAADPEGPLAVRLRRLGVVKRLAYPLGFFTAIAGIIVGLWGRLDLGWFLAFGGMLVGTLVPGYLEITQLRAIKANWRGELVGPGVVLVVAALGLAVQILNHAAH